MAFPHFTAGIDVNAIWTAPFDRFHRHRTIQRGLPAQAARGVPRSCLTLPWRAGLWHMKTSANCYLSPRAAGQSHMKRGSTRSPDEPPVARMRGRWRHPGAVPHVTEFIGRAFARPVGSCGLQASSPRWQRVRNSGRFRHMRSPCRKRGEVKGGSNSSFSYAIALGTARPNMLEAVESLGNSQITWLSSHAAPCSTTWQAQLTLQGSGRLFGPSRHLTAR